jgi:hypothetical protein
MNVLANFHKKENNIKISNNHDLATWCVDRYEQLLGLPDTLDPEGEGGRLPLIITMLASDGCNGNLPIRWTMLLKSMNSDFYADMSGIFDNFNPNTGKLENGFEPQFCVLPMHRRTA